MVGMSITIRQSVQLLRRTLRDLAYGIHAGNAIRHGLTPPAPPHGRLAETSHRRS
jgi:hypothetical protein